MSFRYLSQAPVVRFWGQARGLSSLLCTLDSVSWTRRPGSLCGRELTSSPPVPWLCLAAGGESGKLTPGHVGGGGGAGEEAHKGRSEGVWPPQAPTRTQLPNNQ